MIFSQTLMHWYGINSRNLPWRETKDPYRIWLSEIILQQTRVKQGLPYYKKFIKVFPTVYDLAKSKEENVYKLWQGLGYYSRAQNLHLTAKRIVNEYNGVFPNSHEELKTLKGVGDYTASAIASICFNIPEAVVDGNVFRFLSRFFGIDTPIDSKKGFNFFKIKANKLIKGQSPGDFNQALMDFGSTKCKPKSPDCENCIFSIKCYALKNKKVEFFPVKIKKLKIKTRYFNYLVFHNSKNQTVLEQIDLKGIWHKLYQFPMIESKEIINKPTDQFQPIIAKYSNETSVIIDPIFKTPITHKLSHQKLIIQFWKIELSDNSILPVEKEKVFSFPVPIVIEKFMIQFYKTLA